MTSLARLLAFASIVFSVPGHAAQDLAACSSAEAGSAGTVEAVREVAVPRDIHAFDADVLEHKIRPEKAEQLVVRLDTGPLVVFTHREAQRLQSGQRVRVTLDGAIARVEREAPHCALAPLAGLGQRPF